MQIRKIARMILRQTSNRRKKRKIRKKLSRLKMQQFLPNQDASDKSERI